MCSKIALRAKDVTVYDYCIVEMMGPIVKGPGCSAFVANLNDRGYQLQCEGRTAL
jgi:hypothetical protein